MEKIFDFNQQNVTVECINDEFFFKAQDLAEILEYYSTEKALKIIDEDEKIVPLRGETGQKRKTWFVNESGLFHLILKSTKPAAKEFRKWITGTVLPELRKAGSYGNEFHSQKHRILRDIHKLKFQRLDELQVAKAKVKELEKDLENIDQTFWEVFGAGPKQLQLFSQEQMLASRAISGEEANHV